ncbi:MAG: SGNH/GDSL hydrolase family protein [Nitrospinota bacterium]|nr:SGNH/GDSL hydrolase family protein [Nitrospinota bacterium]
MRRVSKNLFFSLIVLLILIFLAEGIQRVRLALVRRSAAEWLLYGLNLDPKSPPPHVLAYEIRPKVSYHLLMTGVRRFKEPGPRVVTVNRIGFRGSDFRREKSPGVYRIVALGGSSTFGTLNSDEDAYPVRLQTLLNRRVPGRFEVINAGIPGQAPSHLVPLIRREILPLKPDLLIIMNMFNHYFVTTDKDWRRPLIRMRRMLEERSVLFLSLSEKVTFFTDRDTLLGKFFVRFSDFRGYLEEMIGLARSVGARVLLVKQPILPRGMTGKNLLPGSTASEQGWERRFYEKVLRLVDDTAESEGALVADASTLTGGFPLDMFYDAVHLTAGGNRYLAERIFEVLVRNRIVR